MNIISRKVDRITLIFFGMVLIHVEVIDYVCALPMSSDKIYVSSLKLSIKENMAKLVTRPIIFFMVPVPYDFCFSPSLSIVII